MELAELFFESASSQKTVWKKRGETLTKSVKKQDSDTIDITSYVKFDLQDNNNE